MPMESDYLEFYEREAKTKNLWGSMREIVLSENIISEIKSESGNVIDIGCGNGFLLHKLSQGFNFNLFGLDIAKRMLINTREKMPGLKVLRSEITNLPITEEFFDLVICSEVLEHVPEHSKGIRELFRLLKKDGSLILTVPNDQALRPVKCPYCKLSHYLDGHINRFTKEQLVELLHHMGISNVKAFTFYTIFSYNKATMKLPKFIRLFIDRVISKVFKPEYILVKIKKID